MFLFLKFWYFQRYGQKKNLFKVISKLLPIPWILIFSSKKRFFQSDLLKLPVVRNLDHFGQKIFFQRVPIPWVLIFSGKKWFFPNDLLKLHFLRNAQKSFWTKTIFSKRSRNVFFLKFWYFRKYGQKRICSKWSLN